MSPAMTPENVHANHRPRSVPIVVPVVLALAIAACPASADTRLSNIVEFPGVGVQLGLPANWEVKQIIEGRGASVGVPGDDAASLDIIAWSPVAEALTPERAAEAHEQVLAARFSYTRETLEAFTAPDGGKAVAVVGSATSADGEKFTVLWAAYVFDQRYLVMGTFCRPEQAEQVRRSFYSEAIRTFSPIGTPLPSLPQPDGFPGTSPAPVDVTPEPPDVTPEPVDVTPDPVDVTPEPVDVTPPALIEVTDRRGFTLTLPSDWEVTVEDGCIMAWPTSNPRRTGVSIWPLLNSGQASVEKRALLATRAWANRLGTRWLNLESRRDWGARAPAISLGSFEVDGRQARGLALFSPGDTLDLLEVAVFARGTTREDRLRVAEFLSSFRCRPLSLPPVSITENGKWVGADRALEAEPPPGWVLSGGVTLYNETPAIDVQGIHPETGARFAWRQPEAPMYKELTEALAGAGWAEGSQFPPDQGIEPLVLKARAPAVDGAKLSLAESTSLNATAAGRAPNASKLLPNAEAGFAHARGEHREASCLYATADAPGALGEKCWMAASLRYEGPPGAHNAAGAALRALIANVTLGAGWPASSQQREALRALLEGARLAAADLPSSSATVAAKSSVLPAFSRLMPAGAAQAQQVAVPTRGTELWRDAAQAGTPGGSLPELLAEW